MSAVVRGDEEFEMSKARKYLANANKEDSVTMPPRSPWSNVWLGVLAGAVTNHPTPIALSAEG